MNGWCVLGIVLAVLVLLLMVPVGVRLRFDGVLTLKLRIGPLRLQLLPVREKSPAEAEKQKSKKEAKKAKKAAQKTAADTAKKKTKRKRPNREQLFYSVERLGKLLVKVLKKFRRGLRIDPLVLRLTVAGEDPADAAVLYGRLYAAVGGLLPPLKESVSLRGEEIAISLDFDRDTWDVLADVGIYMRVWSVLGIVFCALSGAVGWYLGYRRLADDVPPSPGAEAAPDTNQPDRSDPQAPAA